MCRSLVDGRDDITVLQFSFLIKISIGESNAVPSSSEFEINSRSKKLTGGHKTLFTNPSLEPLLSFNQETYTWILCVSSLLDPMTPSYTLFLLLGHLRLINYNKKIIIRTKQYRLAQRVVKLTSPIFILLIVFHSCHQKTTLCPVL